MSYLLEGYNSDLISVGSAYQETGHRVNVLESLLVAPTALAAKGDPCSFGANGTGVVVSPDTLVATDFAVVQTEGVFNLAVLGADGSGNTAIAVGDAIYIDVAVLNADDSNGILFGYALGAVSSGATTNIPVKLVN